MKYQLLIITQSLQKLYDDGEAVVFNDDLNAVKAVLNAVGYVYLESATNHNHTRITLR